LFRSQGNPVPHLAALTETGEIAIVRDLIGITLEADPRRRSDCLAAISAIVKPLLPDRLPELDETFRRNRYVLVLQDDPWIKLTRKVVEDIPLTGPNDEILIGLCASHSDGYIREAAVARLAHIYSGLELCFLIMRANDWVSAVQMRARTALLERLSAPYAPAFIRHLPMLDYLARATRNDHRSLLNAIESFLLSEEARPALLNGLDVSPEFRIRRQCYELAYRAYIPDVPDWLTEKPMADPDVVIRHRAFLEILSSNRPLSSTLAQRGINDAFAPIRRRIFDFSVRTEGAKNPELVRAFLFDRSTQLRQDAQRFWSEIKLGNPAEVYRESLSEKSPNSVASTLNGLGETGEAADSDVILPFLQHRHSRVRRAAVRAICRLKPEGFLEIIATMMFQDGSTVAAAAAGCIEKHVQQLSASQLWNRARSVNTTDAQVRLLRVFRLMPKWDRLEYLLRAIATSDKARSFAITELDDWGRGFNRSFPTLTPPQRSTLTNLLAETRPWLKSIAGIEFLLKHG